MTYNRHVTMMHFVTYLGYHKMKKSDLIIKNIMVDEVTSNDDQKLNVCLNMRIEQRQVFSEKNCRYSFILNEFIIPQRDSIFKYSLPAESIHPSYDVDNFTRTFISTYFRMNYITSIKDFSDDSGNWMVYDTYFRIVLNFDTLQELNKFKLIYGSYYNGRI